MYTEIIKAVLKTGLYLLDQLVEGGKNNSSKS